jgi:hypothetical protein
LGHKNRQQFPGSLTRHSSCGRMCAKALQLKFSMSFHVPPCTYPMASFYPQEVAWGCSVKSKVISGPLCNHSVQKDLCLGSRRSGTGALFTENPQPLEQCLALACSSTQ